MTIWIGYCVLDRKRTDPEEAFLSRTCITVGVRKENDWVKQVHRPYSASGIVRAPRSDACHYRLVAHTKTKRPNKTAYVLAYGYFITI